MSMTVEVLMAGRNKIATKRGKIWVVAVDPFTGADVEPIWQLVKPLAESANASLVAAYVLAPSALNWTGDFSGPWMKKYIPLAEAKLSQFLPEKDIERVVIPCRDSGLRPAAKALAAFARKRRADSLVIAT